MKKLITFFIAIWIAGALSAQLSNTFKYVINANGDVHTPLGNLMNMQTGVFNVLDYGANRTDTSVNSTATIQACLDAATGGTVYIPAGIYRVDSLHVSNSVNIIGAGNVAAGGTVIYTRTSLPVIHVMNTGAWGYSIMGSIKNLCILGTNRADNGALSQDGISVDCSSDFLIEGVFITNCGGYGIRLAEKNNVDKITIRNCRIGYSSKDGIYGRTNAVHMISAVHIVQNEINVNKHGINILGNNIVIRDNIIQNNDSAGVFLSARDMGLSAGTYDSNNTLIDGNYFEENKAGNIIAESFFDFSESVWKYHNHVVITNNTLLLWTAGLNAGVSSSMIFRAIPGGDGASFWKGMIISGNYFYLDGSLKRVGFNNTFSPFVTLEIGPLEGNAVTTYYDLTPTYQGGKLTGVITGGNFGYVEVVAVSGITIDQLFDYITVYNSSAIDISANPQIVAGFTGQVITIECKSDVNTLKLDNGTGLQLVGGASFTMGAGDVITLRYNGTVWVEVSRSDN